MKPSILERARRYTLAIPATGAGGSNVAFDVAQAHTRGFLLPYDEAFPIFAEWGARCSPPWTNPSEIRHKLHDSFANGKKPLGYLLKDGEDRTLSPAREREAVLKPSAPVKKLVLPSPILASQFLIKSTADSRLIHRDAVSCAVGLGTLMFAECCEHRSWILHDSEGLIAEARRIDREVYPAYKPCNLDERKAHCLGGSNKSWPAGVAVLRRMPQFRAIMLVEGGPDYLAALHFCIAAGVGDVLPIAMLGKGAGRIIHPVALELLRCRRVRIYPHADKDKGGDQAADGWAEQLHDYGCDVDSFDFDGLTQRDGSPVNDLNDCTSISPADEPQLENLLP